MVSAFVLVLFLFGIPVAAVGPFPSIEECSARVAALDPVPDAVTLVCFPREPQGDGKGIRTA